MKRLIALLLFCALPWIGMAAQQTPPPPREKPHFDESNPSVHDPVMAREGKTYYVFGTGLQAMHTRNFKKWTPDRMPFFRYEWAQDAVPEFRGGPWAPDVVFHDGQWHLFYSCSAFGKNTSAIGRMTRSTLDPSSSEEWVDHGEIIRSIPDKTDWNAIDPNIVFDDKGTPWMDFGSFWGGIQLVKMKADLSGTDGEPRTIARRYAGARPDLKNPTSEYAGTNAIEAPFIFKKNGWYYLFVSWDYCCMGDHSTYKVVVGRSRNVQGPYLDKDGVDMLAGGGTLVAFNNDEFNASGHCSVYTFGKTDVYLSHAYNRSDGVSKLIVRQVQWDADGWPTINLDKPKKFKIR